MTLYVIPLASLSLSDSVNPGNLSNPVEAYGNQSQWERRSGLTRAGEMALRKGFYTLLEGEIVKALNNDVKLVIRDFNAQIGREPTYTTTVGKYSLHRSTNDNGEKGIQFTTCGSVPAQRHYKGTWISPDTRAVNQIDHNGWQ